MKLALLFLVYMCSSVMPQLRIIAGTILNDLRFMRLAAVTMGEIAADCLSLNLGSSLIVSAWVLGVLFAATLILQLARERHVPNTYWIAASLNSIAAALLLPALWSADLI